MNAPKIVQVRLMAPQTMGHTRHFIWGDFKVLGTGEVNKGRCLRQRF